MTWTAYAVDDQAAFPLPPDDGPRVWVCPYCGKEFGSECDGADVTCCGERGHAYEKGGPDDDGTWSVNEDF